MNATQNTKANKDLMHKFRDEYISARGTEEYTEDKLQAELITYIGRTSDAAQITSVIRPPHSIPPTGSLPTPAWWFQCTVDKSHVQTIDLNPHRDDKYVTAYHATGVTHALHIILPRYVNAGLGQSANDQGMIYFFAPHDIQNGVFYSVYTFLKDESPYLWLATVECIVNRNPTHGPRKNEPQLVQPPNTATLAAVHFHCVHVK